MYEIYVKFATLWKRRWRLEVFFFGIIDCKKLITQMHKKPRVRTLTDSQHVKGSERLLKSALQYLCHILWSLWKKIMSRKSVFVLSEILELFGNILTPDDKYSLSVNRVFKATSSDATISKSKFFFWITEIYKKLGILWKKRWPS